MMRIAILIAAALAAPCLAAEPPKLEIANGAATVAWLKTYASPNEDWINDIVALEDGSYLAVGFLNRLDGETPSDWRALASKFGANGNIAWTKEFGAGGAVDAFWTAREFDGGRLMFGGFTTRTGPAGINAYFALTNAGGEVLKENGYGTPGYDRITGFAPTPTGFIGAGHAEGVDGRDIFLIGVDKEGVELWRRIFAEKGSNGALYIEPSGDGNFIVTGGTSPRGDADLLIMKVNAKGDELWRRLIGEPGSDDINHGLVVLGDGRIVAAGYTDSWGEGERDFMAAVLAPDGEVVSVETIGGAGDDRAMLAKAGADGRVWIVGHTASAGGMDAMVALLGADGKFQESVLLIGGAADDVVAAVRPLEDGDILVGGYSRSIGGTSADGFVMRLDDIKMRPNPAFNVNRIK